MAVSNLKKIALIRIGQNIGMKAEVDKYVIQKVKERRLELGISQEELSIKINRNGSFISQMERESENRFYNVKQLNHIAAVLKCSPKYFLPDNPIEPFVPTEKKSLK
ncbi:MAG: XRE family transcriptional regulator [Odoribacter sp.]|nr:XRE family transcriptional regulator [Odoribacter sp.]